MAVPRPRRRYIFTSIRISLHLEGFAQLRLESNVGSKIWRLEIGAFLLPNFTVYDRMRTYIARATERSEGVVERKRNHPRGGAILTRPYS